MYIYGLFGSLLAQMWLCSGLLVEHCQMPPFHAACGPHEEYEEDHG